LASCFFLKKAYWHLLVSHDIWIAQIKWKKSFMWYIYTDCWITIKLTCLVYKNLICVWFDVHRFFHELWPLIDRTVSIKFVLNIIIIEDGVLSKLSYWCIPPQHSTFLSSLEYGSCVLFCTRFFVLCRRKILQKQDKNSLGNDWHSRLNSFHLTSYKRHNTASLAQWHTTKYLNFLKKILG
jgi:hypothetical protein